MHKTALILSLVMLAVCTLPAAGLAAPESVPFTLNTDGRPVFCGNAARMFLSETGAAPPAVLLDAETQSELAADQLAATGNLIQSAESQQAFVLTGDITGSGAFNIAQLVSAAQILAGREATSLQELAGDLTGNGAIDIADLVILAGYVRDAKEPEPSAAYPDAPQESRTLVVCFSATGSTRRAAELIAEAADADLFEIEPADPYTAADLNYNDPESRVSREHRDPALRNVPLVYDSVPGWEEYDRVFVGYPIWWGIAAWPVSSFVAANSFDGKDCWCFCTSASSGVGSSASQLAQTASGGSWLGSHRFSSNPAAGEVDAWLDSIDAAA